MTLRVFALGAILALAGCTHSSIVLLPNENGGHGEVSIRPLGGVGGETTMSDSNTRATLGESRPSIRPLGSNGLNPSQALLVSALPPAAKSFDLYFHEGTTDMIAQSLPVLDQIRAEIAKRPGADVQVTGHTDTVGNDSDNDTLSKQRAHEILNLLVNKGFARTKMSAVGRGERELKVHTTDNVRNSINRRVEVIVR